MGTIARHPGAPYVRGEILDGTIDLEVDINNIVTEVNGNLDTSNLKSTTANLTGSQLANNTIPTAKLQDNAVTTAKMAASAVASYGLTQAASSSALAGGTGSAWTNVEDLSAITITPGSALDLLVMQFTGSIAVTTRLWVAFTVSLNGVDQFSFSSAGDDYAPYVQASWSYSRVAGTTSPLTIRARYKNITGINFSCNWDTRIEINRTFSVMCIPIKA